MLGGTAEEPATLKTIEPPSQGTSGIVRGRDLPFPAAPIYRRRTLQANPRNVDSSILFQRRYSAVSLPAVSSPPVTKSDALSSRGRTMQCTRPSLSRSDSRTLTLPETSEENLSHRRMSRNTLLRIPPFPLPHRLLQRPASESSARKVGSVRPISRRMTSIPPPLVLDSIFSYLDEEDEESPVLGREEARRLQQLRTRSTSRAQVL
ncbi:hypothetical protein DXG01_009489 [Tephrocybe rancida]|nr:hypothetical protein DXG01_009489 [Tephrocybe rancida]